MESYDEVTVVEVPPLDFSEYEKQLDNPVTTGRGESEMHWDGREREFDSTLHPILGLGLGLEDLPTNESENLSDSFASSLHLKERLQSMGFG